MQPMMGMNPNNNTILFKSYPTLYVGDLEEQITEEMLYNYFSKFGNIYSVRVMRDIHYKKSRGFAFITFYDTKDGKKTI